MTMQSTGGFGTPRVTAECTGRRARQARAECRGRRTQLFFHAMGAGAPAHPSIFFPLGLAVAVSECRTSALSESGSIFKFGPPDDDAKHGRLRNPTGHGGVYK